MKLSLKTYRDFLITYLQSQKRRVLLMSVVMLTGIGLQLLNPQILGYFIDTATAGGSLTVLMEAGVLFIIIAFIDQALTIWATYLSENVAWTATNQLRTDLVAHCLTLDMGFHKAHTAGELIERVDGDVNTLSLFFSELVIKLLGNMVLVIGVLVLLFLEDWRIGISMSVFVLIALGLLAYLRGLAVRFWERDRQQSADFYGFLGEQLVGTEDIRANGAEYYVMWCFYQLLRNWLPVRLKAALMGFSMWTTTLILFGIGNAVAFALGAYLWSTGVISIGTVYLTFYYTNLILGPISQIRNQLQELQQAGAGIQRVQQLLLTKSALADGIGIPLPEGPLSVEFKNVSFGYNIDDFVLHGLNFHVPPEKVLGILGRTGSGKTTLARLLLRLYDPQEGEISIGNVAVQAAYLRQLRQHIGMVTQDIQLFHATVRDNLTFYNRAISDAQIIETLDDLGLSSWLRSLPEGLDTELGSDGEGLSAGEAQLLAFTRVFLADPGLVILDEASSRLDPATEILIEKAISKLFKGRTAIVIAHRLATLKRADEILVLEAGCILEYGNREMLLADPTSYYYNLLQTGLEEVTV